MSKKTKTEKPNKKAKKHGCCFKCCMSALITAGVMFAAIVGCAWYFGDKYSQEYLGMPLAESWAVLSGIANSNDSLIDNPVTEPDEFYGSLDRALFLKEGTIQEADLLALIAEEEGGNGGAVLPMSQSTDEVSNGSADKLEEFVSKIFTAETLDYDRIQAYSEDNKDEYRLNVADKALGGFLNRAVKIVVSSLPQDELPKELRGVKLEQFLDVNQLTIYETQGENKTFRLKLTASIQMDDIINEVYGRMDLSEYVGGGIPDILLGIGGGVAKLAIKMVTPKIFYLTADIDLAGEAAPSVQINNMNAKQMDNLYKIANIAAQVDVQEELNKVFISEEGGVKPVLDSLTNTVALDDIFDDGKINIDAIQMIIDLAKINYETNDKGEETLKPVNRQIKSGDLMNILKFTVDVGKSDFTETIKSAEYSYKSYKFQTDAYGKLIFESGQPVVDFSPEYYVTGKEEIDLLLNDYKQWAVNEFSIKYGMKNDLTFDEIIEIFTGENFDEDTVLEMFDPQLIKGIIEGEAAGLVINDRMVAAIASSLLANMQEMEFDLSAMGIEYVSLQKQEHNLLAHNIMEIGIFVDVKEMLKSVDGGEAIANIAGGLFGERVIVSVRIDITPNTEDFIATTVRMNDKTIEAIEKLADALALFKDDKGAPVAFSEYFDNILSPVKDAINNMYNMLPGIVIEESELKLPDVYAALETFVNGEKKSGDEGYVSGDVLQSALKLIVADGVIADATSPYHIFANAGEVEANEKKNLDALKKELNEKYAVSFDAGNGKEYTIAEILHILGVIELEESGIAENKEIFDLIDKGALADIAAETGASEEAILASLKIRLTNTVVVDNMDGTDMLSALMKETLNSGGYSTGIDGLDLDDVLFVKLYNSENKTFAKIAVKVDLSVLLDAQSGQEGNAVIDFMKKLLPESETLITVTVEITPSATEYAPSEIVINENAELSQNLFELLSAFDIDLGLDGDNSISETIRTAFGELTQEGTGICIDGGQVVIDDIFSMAKRLVNENAAQGKEITAIELKDILDAVLNSEVQTYGSDYDFRNWYYTDATGLNKVYNAAGGNAQLSVDFAEELNTELLAAYALKTHDNSGKKYTLTDTMSMLGLGGQKLDVADLVDGNELEKLVFADSINGITVDHRQFGALVTSQFNSFAGASTEFSAENIKYVFVTVEESKTYLNIVASIALTDKITSGNLVGLKKILPTECTFTLKINLDEEPSAAQFIFNDLTAKRTDDLLKTLEKSLLDKPIDFDGLVKGINDAIDGIEKVVDVGFDNQGMQLPDLFSLINSAALENAFDSGADVKEVLQAVYATSSTAITVDGKPTTRKAEFIKNKLSDSVKASTDYNALLTQVRTKYFINRQINDFDDLFALMNTNEFDATVINVSGNNGMAYTTQSCAELKPIIDNGSLGAILREYMPEGSNYSIYSAQATSTGLTIFVTVSIDGMFEGNDSLGKYLTVDEIFVRLTVKTNEVLKDETGADYYACDVLINEMPASTQTKLLTFVNKFSNNSTAMDDASKEIGKAAKNGLDVMYNAIDKEDIEIDEKGIALPDIFSFLSTTLVPEAKLTGEGVKEALQSLYPFDEAKSGENKNNFTRTDVVVNTISTDITIESILARVAQQSSVSDSEMGGYISSIIDGDIGELSQFNILAMNPSATDNAKKDRDYLFGRGYTLDENKTYFVVSIDMNTQKMGILPTNFAVLIPQSMTVSFIMEFNGADNTVKLTDFMLNSMKTATLDNLISLTGIDDARTNLSEQSEDVLNKLNGLLNTLASTNIPFFKFDRHEFSALNTDTRRGQYKAIFTANI